ncbi:MAG: ComEC/Rec2 family competence protein [candidate division WOR-3 bacterium]
MRTVVLKLCIAVGLGIMLGKYLPVPLLLGGLTVAATLVALILKSRILGYFVIFLMSACNYCLIHERHLAIKNFPLYNQNLKIFGQITDREFQERLVYKAKVYKLNNIPTSGKVFLYTNQILRCGDFIELEGKITKFRAVKNPNLFDYAEFYHRQGFWGIIYDQHGRIEKFPSRSISDYWSKILFSVREYLQHTVNQYLKDETAGLLLRVLLGDRHELPSKLKAVFSDLGISHIFAVSGLHIAMLVGLLLVTCMTLGIRKRARLMVVGILIVFYLAIINFRTPAARAALMSILGLLGYLLERDYEPSHGLLLAALIILVISPQALFEVSFQLSFVTTLGIILITPKIYYQRELQNLPQALKQYLVLPALVSFSATVANLPLVGYYFYKITPYGIVANLLILPLLTLVFPLAALLFGFNLVVKPLALVYSQSLWIFLKVIICIANHLARLPYRTIITGRWSTILILGYYLGVLLFLYWSHITRRKELIYLVLIITNIWVWYQNFKPPSISITFLDTIQGESIVIELPSQQVIVIDAGPENAILRNYLLSKGLTQVNLAVITHPHLDHYGGFRNLLTDFQLPNWCITTSTAPDTLYTNLIKEIQQKFSKIIIAQRGMSIKIQNLTLEVLHPSKEVQRLASWDNNFDLNNLSIVLKLTCNNLQLLFLGDLTDFNLMPDSDLKAQIVKAPHHGSRFVDYPWLLARTQPQFLIVTSAPRLPEGLITLSIKDSIKIINTRSDGAIELKIQNKFYTIQAADSRD